MQLMTSVMTAEENCPDDFEEGEILDDDSPVCSQENSNVDHCSIYSGLELLKSDVDIKKNSPNCGNRGNRGTKHSKYNMLNKHVVGSLQSDPLSVRRQGMKSKENKSFRVKDLRSRSEKYLDRRRYTPIRKRFSDKDVRKTRPGVPYEHQLRDFKFINSRLRERSNSCDERKRKCFSGSIVKTNDSNTSLLKRLVGSGSLGIKQPKQTQKDVDKCEPCPKDSANIDNDKNVNSESACDIKIDKTSSEDDDELNLRMEALKTAMLKKHMKRREKGIIIHKKSNPNDSVLDGELSAGLVSGDVTVTENEVIGPCSNELNRYIDNSCSDKSRDSSDININSDIPFTSESSFSLTVLESTVDIPIEKCTDTEIILKKQDTSIDVEPPYKKVKSSSIETAIDDESINEIELRKLALMSCWPKGKSSRQTNIDSNIIDNGDIDMRNNANEKIIKEKKKTEPEDWEEVDENILRAQLLQTLSDNLPGGKKISGSAKQVTAFTLKNGLSAQKKEIDAELEMKCKLWSEKMVPRLVISLASDTDSEVEDIEKSVDQLLMEARKNCDQVSHNSTNTNAAAKFKVKRKVLGEKAVKPTTNTLSSTPLAMKHLPIHRQEEYKRLKIKLAEKEKLRKTILKKQTEKRNKHEISSKSKSEDNVATGHENNSAVSGSEAESSDSKLVDDSLTIMCRSAKEVEEARARYDESVSCIERLKKELQEAEERLVANEKLLLERGVVAHNHWVNCCQNIHRWISASKSVPESEKNLVKRILDQEYQRASKAKLLPQNKTKDSLDPDGVLCPFHLSGCCKDPSCSFQHIQLPS